MAHEITQTDGAIYHERPAWHGLGLVVEDAPTPLDGLILIGQDWLVEQEGLLLPDGTPVEGYRANLRSDNRALLGVVTDGYVPVHNRDVAAFAEALAEGEDVVRCESIGTIRGGKKIWFLLKGESFSVRSEDEVRPYILVSAAHDGTGAVRATPTTVRVVCSNTLHMVIPDGKGEGNRTFKTDGISIKHTTNVMQRVEEAKRALRLYNRHLESTKEVFKALSDKDVSKSDIEKFWLDVYARQFGKVPTNPKNKVEERRRDRAVEAFGQMAQRFDRERKLAGTSAWNALNAYTGWVENDRYIRGKDDEARKENRAHQKLLGVDGDRAVEALNLAMAI